MVRLKHNRWNEEAMILVQSRGVADEQSRTEQSWQIVDNANINTEQRVWSGLKHRKQRSQLKNIVQIGLGDDGSDTNTQYNGKRENGLDTNTVQRRRVDDGPDINTGVERGQISDAEGKNTYQRMQTKRGWSGFKQILAGAKRRWPEYKHRLEMAKKERSGYKSGWSDTYTDQKNEKMMCLH